MKFLDSWLWIYLSEKKTVTKSVIIMLNKPIFSCTAGSQKKTPVPGWSMKSNYIRTFLPCEITTFSHNQHLHSFDISLFGFLHVLLQLFCDFLLDFSFSRWWFQSFLKKLFTKYFFQKKHVWSYLLSETEFITSL